MHACTHTRTHAHTHTHSSPHHYTPYSAEMNVIKVNCVPLLCRCVKMALVHDMAECIVGDLTPHDNVSKEEKHSREKVSTGSWHHTEQCSAISYVWQWHWKNDHKNVSLAVILLCIRTFCYENIVLLYIFCIFTNYVVILSSWKANVCVCTHRQ